MITREEIFLTKVDSSFEFAFIMPSNICRERIKCLQKSSEAMLRMKVLIVYLFDGKNASIGSLKEMNIKAIIIGRSFWLCFQLCTNIDHVIFLMRVKYLLNKAKINA